MDCRIQTDQLTYGSINEALKQTLAWVIWKYSTWRKWYEGNSQVCHKSNFQTFLWQEDKRQVCKHFQATKDIHSSPKRPHVRSINRRNFPFRKDRKLNVSIHRNEHSRTVQHFSHFRFVRMIQRNLFFFMLAHKMQIESKWHNDMSKHAKRGRKISLCQINQAINVHTKTFFKGIWVRKNAWHDIITLPREMHDLAQSVRQAIR